MIINEDVSVGHTIISNIQSFMSDRTKVNISFTELLQQYKSEILSYVKKDWETLSNEQNAYAAKLITSSTCKYGRVHIAYSQNI